MKWSQIYEVKVKSYLTWTHAQSVDFFGNFIYSFLVSKRCAMHLSLRAGISWRQLTSHFLAGLGVWLLRVVVVRFNLRIVWLLLLLNKGILIIWKAQTSLLNSPHPGTTQRPFGECSSLIEIVRGWNCWYFHSTEPAVTTSCSCTD